MKPYYVWKDLLLDELFAMEKEDFDTNCKVLKEQLEKEKVEFIEINAEGMKDACNKYRDLLEAQREAILSDETYTANSETVSHKHFKELHENNDNIIVKYKKDNTPPTLKNKPLGSKKTLH